MDSNNLKVLGFGSNTKDAVQNSIDKGNIEDSETPLLNLSVHIRSLQPIGRHNRVLATHEDNTKGILSTLHASSRGTLMINLPCSEGTSLSQSPGQMRAVGLGALGSPLPVD